MHKCVCIASIQRERGSERKTGSGREKEGEREKERGSLHVCQRGGGREKPQVAELREPT
jgi:hypothetical protein